jgi:hypothetical protein
VHAPFAGGATQDTVGRERRVVDRECRVGPRTIRTPAVGSKRRQTNRKSTHFAKKEYSVKLLYTADILGVAKRLHTVNIK